MAVCPGGSHGASLVERWCVMMTRSGRASLTADIFPEVSLMEMVACPEVGGLAKFLVRSGRDSSVDFAWSRCGQ